ncbi:transcriptional regulator [Actinomycetaceae bacterium TAE3-ERU4]|nr:transcriptional regulator [Actinomycetaceae bacterium TAE3-ERU4]
MTVKYLSLREFGEYIGVTYNTIRQYYLLGRLPEPDVEIGARKVVRGWSVGRVESWQSKRPRKEMQRLKSGSETFCEKE